MRTSDAPQLSKKWWISEKPAEIKGIDLERALQAAEKALADEKKKSDPLTLDSCLAALRAVGAAAQKTVGKECDKKKHKDVITVLSKFDPLIKSETCRLEELKKKAGQCAKNEDEEDDDTNDDKLFDRSYLHDMIKLLKSTGKELRFSFGLDTKSPENSKLLLAKKGKPEKLFKALKRTGEFNNRLMTCGYALPDSVDGETLVFRLEEGVGEPPQIVKLCRQFLRSDKNLKFRKVKLVLPGGQTIEDTDQDTQTTQADDRSPSKESSLDQRTRRDLLKKQARLLKARQAWILARDQARRDILEVKKALRAKYSRDPKQLPVVMQKAKQLDAIFDDISDDLLRDLDQYTCIRSGASADASAVENAIKHQIERAAKYIENNLLLSAVDDDERFVPAMKIKPPLLTALRSLQDAVA